MATITRSFIQGQHYHVYNRGHHKEVIFRDRVDRVYFLSKLDEFCERDEMVVLAYCLLDNHFHLILRQDGVTPISSTMGSLLAGYVRMYNQKYGEVGGLFQGRFQAKFVHDEAYLVHLSRYVHLNPHPSSDYRTYPWSSYRQYAVGAAGICEVASVMDYFGGVKANYATYVESAVSPGED